jgi:hypothetical protein
MSNSNSTLEEVRDHFRMLQQCCLHIGSSLSAEDIVAVHGKQGDDFGRTEASRATWVEFADGRHGVIYDSEDFTGHGCMCSSSLEYFDDSASARRAMAAWPGY